MRKHSQLIALLAILALPALLAAALPSPAAAAPAAATTAGADTSAGLKAFTDLKCQMCHSIDSKKVARTTKSEKMKGPDLSTVGSTHNAEWFTEFLRGEVGNDSGKKHEKAWKGTDDQLKQVSAYLASLKTK
jgi:mono/diheme cytochrome c family protein